LLKDVKALQKLELPFTGKVIFIEAYDGRIIQGISN